MISKSWKKYGGSGGRRPPEIFLQLLPLKSFWPPSKNLPNEWSKNEAQNFARHSCIWVPKFISLKISHESQNFSWVPKFSWVSNFFHESQKFFMSLKNFFMSLTRPPYGPYVSHCLIITIFYFFLLRHRFLTFQ